MAEPSMKVDLAMGTAGEEEARSAVKATIRKYALEAAWPSENRDQIKTLLLRLATEIAAMFGKLVDDISLEDISRTLHVIESVIAKSGLHKVGFRRMNRAAQLYKEASAASEIVSHVYWIGNAFAGNFGPAVRKLGLKTGGAPLARAAGVWLAGQAIAELYFDPAKFKTERPKYIEYFPLFDALSLDQYRELAVFMGIDARVSWDIQRLRKEILSELTSAQHNMITALWSEAPQYKAILLGLCEELDVPGYQANDSDELLEERIVQRVIADSIKKLTPGQLVKFEDAIRASEADNYWNDSLKSSLFAGGLVAGNMTGFGLYVAASSGLAALGQGLGITFAFGTYTTLSTALSVVFGPLGIASALTIAALHWTKARPKKALPFVLYMAAARGRLASSSGKMSIFDRTKAAVRRLYLWIGSIGAK